MEKPRLFHYSLCWSHPLNKIERITQSISQKRYAERGETLFMCIVL